MLRLFAFKRNISSRCANYIEILYNFLHHIFLNDIYSSCADLTEKIPFFLSKAIFSMLVQVTLSIRSPSIRPCIYLSMTDNSPLQDQNG